MIQLKEVLLNFGSQKIFDEISLNVSTDDRIGLVGLNGSGKSTLLKVISGFQKLDDGSVSFAKGMNVAYMPQEVVLSSTLSILDEVLGSVPDLGKLYLRINELENSGQELDEKSGQEYSEIVCEFQASGGEQLIAKAKQMLNGLGFANDKFTMPVDSLSVGWKMRIVLAQLLLKDADFYLFDEPTNHLDIVAKDWFVNFLHNSTFGFLLVCHERYVLNEICDSIFELEYGKGTLYRGNYDKYKNQKAFNSANLLSAYNLQQKEIEQKQKTIDRFKAKASKASMAKSMAKQLDKIEKIELPPSPKSVNFSFPDVLRPGKIILDVKNLAFSFPEKKIFQNVSFQIERGEKVALVASNGVGKTTLFNVLIEKYKPTGGTSEFGYNVKPSIFEQDQNKVLDPNKTIIDQIMSSVSNKPESMIRSFLGAFLFSREDVYKKTKVLSGGEKNRVSMVSTLLQDANFLLLDEPTNHLDMQSKEILLKAMNDFSGTLLFVSHDHDFVNDVATRILELTPDGIFSYHGNYDSYKNQKESQNLNSENDSNSENSSKTKSVKIKESDPKKDIQKIEKSIQKLDQEINLIREQFADLEYGTKEFKVAQKKLDELEAMHKELSASWEKMN